MADDDTRVANQLGSLTAQVKALHGDVKEMKATLRNGFGARLRETGTQVAVLEETVENAITAMDSTKSHHAELAKDVQGMSSTLTAIQAARKVEIRHAIAWTGAVVGMASGLAVFAITVVIPKWIMSQ